MIDPQPHGGANRKLVHPRVAMQILRHADFKITMEIYTQVSSTQTVDALKRLSDSLDAA